MNHYINEIEMHKERIIELKNSFESIVEIEDNIEFWSARDLSKSLDYPNWHKFKNVLQKAMNACKNSGESIEDHFYQTVKMISLAKGAKRKIEDFVLTRYACYLIAQNGDSKKEEIAFAQTYFAVQTRKMEVLEERIKLIKRISTHKKLTNAEKELAENLFEKGVDQEGFQRIKEKGNAIFFGGNSTDDMKSRLKTPENRELEDFLPTVTLAGKLFSTELTSHNVKDKDLSGEEDITDEHETNNSGVRDLMLNRGIRVEDLPPEEDLKKLEKKVLRDGKRLPNKKKKK